MEVTKNEIQSDMTESLSNHIQRIEDFLKNVKHDKIIISSELEVDSFHENHGITKIPLIWPLMNYKRFYIVHVPPFAKISKHSNDEAIFRILISGTLTLNDVLIDTPGTWYVVPAFVDFEVSTETGYCVLKAYTSYGTTLNK